ncbi:hypothetical protein EV363DRAFT_1176698 [Boletus edulis]|nr:hypothetical protein EV363DRAFT_1176698 [Boletus edulis]
MESSIVLYPSFFLPSEKATSSLQTVFNTPARHTPREWLDIVLENDPEHNYIVTNLWHYKQRLLPLLDCQHEYIILEVQPRPLPSPALPPTLIKVSRTIVNRSFPARLGLWGPATDTIEILPLGTQFTDHCLHQLTWPQHRAPDLYHISRFIHAIHTAMPRYFLVRTSCYAFAGAIKDSIHVTLGPGRDERSLEKTGRGFRVSVHSMVVRSPGKTFHSEVGTDLFKGSRGSRVQGFKATERSQKELWTSR